jgi:lipid-A-disaccharide synthase
MKIAMVAGEHSGDVLGAGLIIELRKHYPQASFYGIGGPKMLAEGFNSLYPMHRLSVFGLFEVLKHLPGLLKLRAELTDTLLSDKPDVFIGIDGPDFNLKLERTLHNRQIKTVHYVSPTVWAWRPKRIKKLVGALDALLCIFPFEEEYFKDKNVPAFYIGHPLADKLSKETTINNCRGQFGLEKQDTVLTLMPGSRLGEIDKHGQLFLEAAKLCQQTFENLKILVPMPDAATADAFRKCYQPYTTTLNVSIHITGASELISASDVVLVASGTATLEIMLLNKPMVVAYKVSPLTAWVIQAFEMLKIQFVSMPNLIAGKKVVPEFLQEAATPKALSTELITLLSSSKKSNDMLNEFADLKERLTCNADYQAAKVVHQVIEGSVGK